MAPTVVHTSPPGPRAAPATRTRGAVVAVTAVLAVVAAVAGCSSSRPAGAAGAAGAAPVADPPNSVAVSTDERVAAAATQAPASVPAAVGADQPCTETEGRVDGHEYQSSVMRIVKPDQRYLVYTPPCYDARPSRRYPTLYLLHGANTDEHQWTDLGLADTADRLIADGEIPPVVIVLPDGLDGMGDYEGDPVPFDYFVLHEIVPLVEADYRALPDGAHRAIGGISRGGEWALLVAGRNPDAFAAAGGHSPAVGPPSTPNPVLAPLLADKGLRLWLDVGDGDGLAGLVAALHGALDAAGVDHAYEHGPGGHDRAYWGSHVAEYLRWYTAPWLAEQATP